MWGSSRFWWALGALVLTMLVILAIVGQVCGARPCMRPIHIPSIAKVRRPCHADLRVPAPHATCGKPLNGRRLPGAALGEGAPTAEVAKASSPRVRAAHAHA